MLRVPVDVKQATQAAVYVTIVLFNVTIALLTEPVARFCLIESRLE
jgi:hypothetical protein